MPRFSVDVSTLFGEVGLLDGVRAARRAGFRAVEMRSPYDVPLPDLLAVKRRTRMRVALIDVPAGDLTQGGPGLAAMPGREAEFRDAVTLAQRYAKALRPINVNVLAGTPPPELGRERCMETLADNLRHAATAMEDIGVGVVVEAVNTRDRPGFFLSTSSEALAAIEWAAHANLRMLYDVYHMQIMEGDLVPTLERIVDRVGHIQFADSPGRHQPGTGEINFPFLFRAIDRMGYRGWIGAQYVPGGRTEETLDWFKPYRGRGRAPEGP